MPHAKVSKLQRDRAKSLREVMTPAETLLWRYLKAHRIDGLGFRRQLPFRNYIVDFACLAAKLIVELDGESHNFESQRQSDQARDALFASEGFAVLRFTNDQVMSNLEGVVEVIRRTAAARIRGLPPSLTLPHKGGGNRIPTRSSQAAKQAQPVPSPLMGEGQGGGATRDVPKSSDESLDP